MDWQEEKCDAYLGALIEDQETELDMFPLKRALVNQPPRMRKLALICAITMLKHIHTLPVTRWVPEPDRRYEVFFHAAHALVMEYIGCAARSGEETLVLLDQLFTLC